MMTCSVALIASLLWSGTKPAVSPNAGLLHFSAVLTQEKKKRVRKSAFVGGVNTVKILHILGIFCMYAKVFF